MLHVKLFGLPQFKINGCLSTQLGESPVLVSLLGYLVFHKGVDISRSKLAELFWPEHTEQQARQLLNANLWRLRKILGGIATTVLSCKRESVKALASGIHDDVREFWALAHQNAEQCSDSDIASMLDCIKTHFREEFLCGYDFDWCNLCRSEFSQALINFLMGMGVALETKRRYALLLPAATQLVDLDPYSEAGYQWAIDSHIALKQMGQAEAVYGRYQHIWTNELRVPVSPEMTALAVDYGLNQSLKRDIETAIVKTNMGQPDSNASTEIIFAQSAYDLGQLMKQKSLFRKAKRYLADGLSALSVVNPKRQQVQQAPSLEWQLRVELDQVCDLLEDRTTQTRNLNGLRRLVQQQANPGHILDYQLRRSWFLFGIGKLGKAEVMIQQAIPNCIEASSLLMAHRIYSCIAFNQSCFRLAHHHSAIAHALTQRQAPQGVALVYDELNLMAASTAMGDYDNAYAHLKQIRHITADKPPKITADLMIKVDANEGLLLLKTARFAESEAILLKAQQQAKQLGCRSDEVWIAGRLIDLCCQQSRLDLAQSYAESYWKLANQYQLAQQMLDIGQLMIKILLATNDLISVEAWLKTLAQQTTDTEYFRYKVILKLLEAKWHIANSEPMQAQQTIADLDALLGAHSEPLLEAIEVAQLKQDLV